MGRVHPGHPSIIANHGDRSGRVWWLAPTALVAMILLVGAVLAPTSGAAPPDDTDPAPGSADASLGSLHAVVDQIGARDLWEQGITGAGVTVALVDTGIAPVPALSGADTVVAMVDLSAEAEVPEARYLDTYGHGTHLAGIVAGRDAGADPLAATGASGSFLGVAPGAGLVSVKVADNTGAVDVSQVIAGIEWVVEHREELGIRVLNLAFGTDSTQDYRLDPLARAVEEAWNAGLVVVVAAGNDGKPAKGLAMPARDPYVITVGGARPVERGDGRVAFEVPEWASTGDRERRPDVAAPGASIESLRAPGSRIDVDYPASRVGEDRFRGTGSSQAAAVVSGAAALLLQQRPELTPDEVKALLMATARPVAGTATARGRGLVDVAAAARAAVPVNAVQTWPTSDGSGSLEASRGTSHVVYHGALLDGDMTASGARWTGARWTGARWTGARWTGASWTDAEWRGASWTGASWTGASWTGASWTGASWYAEQWLGASWTGASWTGASWTGASWTGASWTGARWTGASWTGARWTGAAWTGASWVAGPLG